MPELAQKIKMYFALAPIATVKHAKSPGTKFLLLPDMMIKVCDSSENSLSMYKSLPAQYAKMYTFQLESLLFDCNVIATILFHIFTGIVWQERISVPDQISPPVLYLPLWPDNY